MPAPAPAARDEGIDMKRRIGSTDLVVNAVGFGAWQLSNVNRPPPDQAREVVRAALEGGADLIDTADCYALDDREFGHNETLVRDALEALGRKAEVHVATKVGIRRPGGAWVPDGRPERIRACCDASLARLGVEAITLYQLHTPDPEVPIEETLGAMAELQSAGKVRHIGVSNFDAGQLERGLSVARVESVQNRCNPWAREDVDNGLTGRCRELGISYVPYHPVGGEEGHRACASDPELRRLSERYGVSPYRLLIRWLLALGDHVLPIPGATRTASITDSLRATELEVSDEDLAAIGRLAA